jgi:uncharacterized protein YueI
MTAQFNYFTKFAVIAGSLCLEITTDQIKMDFSLVLHRTHAAHLSEVQLTSEINVCDVT